MPDEAPRPWSSLALFFLVTMLGAVAIIAGSAPRHQVYFDPYLDAQTRPSPAACWSTPQNCAGVWREHHSSYAPAKTRRLPPR